ncbi:MAG: ankyrin repeat domain-containing protein, partial [Vulcanimicrobiota bacterium]
MKRLFTGLLRREEKDFLVEVLLSAGAEVNVTDGRGKTPVEIAAEKGHGEILGVLQSYMKPSAPFSQAVPLPSAPPPAPLKRRTK